MKEGGDPVVRLGMEESDREERLTVRVEVFSNSVTTKKAGSEGSAVGTEDEDT